MRVGDNRLRHAAHHETCETGPSVRPDDDKVRLPFIGSIDDGRSRIALANLCFDRQPRRREAWARLPCKLLGLLRLSLSNLFERRRSQDNLRGWRGVRLNHRQNPQAAWTGPRAAGHFLESILRRSENSRAKFQNVREGSSVIGAAY